MIDRLTIPAALLGLAALAWSVEFTEDPKPALVEAAPPIAGAPEPAAEPLPEWLTWEEARGSERPVLVFQHFARAEDRNACLPCKRLEVTLKDEETLKELGKLGVLVSDTAERWQGTDTPTAPAIALVPPGAKDAEKVKTFTGFRVSPPEAFLQDLRAWLENAGN